MTTFMKIYLLKNCNLHRSLQSSSHGPARPSLILMTGLHTWLYPSRLGTRHCTHQPTVVSVENYRQWWQRPPATHLVLVWCISEDTKRYLSKIQILLAYIEECYGCILKTVIYKTSCNSSYSCVGLIWSECIFEDTRCL